MVESMAERRIVTRLTAAATTAAILAGCGGGGSDSGISVSGDTRGRNVVVGRIHWSNVKPFPVKAAMRIRLIDATYAGADGPFEQVATQTVDNVPFEAGIGKGFAFRIATDKELKALRYSVDVELDANGDGLIGVGDYISESFAFVDRKVNPPFVTVEVTELESCSSPDARGFCSEGAGNPFR